MTGYAMPGHGIIITPDEWRAIDDGAPRDGRRVWVLSEHRYGRHYCDHELEPRGYYYKTLARYDTWNQKWREDVTVRTCSML